MRKRDLHWMDNKERFYIDKSLSPRLREDAPPEAKESYKNYLAESKNRILPSLEISLLGNGDVIPNKCSKRGTILK